MKRIAYIVFFALLVAPLICNAETIDVQIKGVDDGARTTTQRDYKEAVLFAKREAIERAGVKIKSMTTVRDMVVNSDYIESKAEAVLMPGYNIIDIGYTKDGTYQIVLIGKVKTVSEGIDSKELRYAKSLMDIGKKSKAERITTDIIANNKDDNAVAEAMYCQVLWKFASDDRDTFERLKAYYPNSKYVSLLKSILADREAERRRIEAEREADREAERRRIEADREAERRRIINTRGNIIARHDRFAIHSTGVVYDEKTGLEWFAGPDRDIQRSTIGTWVKNLTVAGGSWRMPKYWEIQTVWKALGQEGIKRIFRISGDTLWAGGYRTRTHRDGQDLDRSVEMQRGTMRWQECYPGRSVGLRGIAVRSRKDDG